MHSLFLLLAAAAGTESTDATTEATTIPATGLGCWLGGAVASSDSSTHCCGNCQQPQSPGTEGLLI